MFFTNIHVGAGDVQGLAENWTTQWWRAPTYEELRGLISDYVNEQLLAREARALGLEDNDVIVRRRLAQKLTFLVDDTLRRAEPSETELQRFYEAHAERFRSDARISFAHIYFSPERRINARADAADALRVLHDGGASLPTGQQGDRLLIETEFHDESEHSNFRCLRSLLTLIKNLRSRKLPSLFVTETSAAGAFTPPAAVAVAPTCLPSLHLSASRGA